DNVLFVLGGADADGKAAALDAVFRVVCHELGVALKEKACVRGPEVDWLGVVGRAGSPELRFRRTMENKLHDLIEVISARRIVMSVRAWWRAIAVVLHCLWVRREPLGVIGETMRWVSRTASRLAAGDVHWESHVTLWSAAQEELQRVTERVH